MSIKEETSLSESVLLFVLSFASVPVWCWACVTLWQWFAIPLGLPHVGYAHAYGIRTLSWMFHVVILPNENDGYTSAKRSRLRVGMAFFVPLWSVLMGWIAHSFMH
jgi:hypothetical protein